MTRREQNLQEVPISIVAVTGERCRCAGSTPGASEPTDRNPSSGGPGGRKPVLPCAASRVGTYVDGYGKSARTDLTEQFVDIDRIEVLRGPQGTGSAEIDRRRVRIWTKSRRTVQRDGTVTAGRTPTRVTASVDVAHGQPPHDSREQLEPRRLHRASRRVLRAAISISRSRVRPSWTPTKLTWRFNYQYDARASSREIRTPFPNAL
jgi:hypothetical protein